MVAKDEIDEVAGKPQMELPSIRIFVRTLERLRFLSIPRIGRKAFLDIRDIDGQLIVGQDRAIEEKHRQAIDEAIQTKRWICLLGREESEMVDQYLNGKQGTLDDLQEEDIDSLPVKALTPGVSLRRGVYLLGTVFIYMAEDISLSQQDINFLLKLNPGTSYYIHMSAHQEEKT
jgi:hypothetical protein